MLLARVVDRQATNLLEIGIVLIANVAVVVGNILEEILPLLLV